MITDQGRWDDRDYYDEHFYDIMYDKITEGMKLTVDEMDNLVSAGLFDKEIVPHEEYLEVNDNNQKMRTIVTNTLRSVGLSIHTKIQNFQMIQWK